MKKVFVLVAVLAASPALADPVIWDNGMTYSSGYSSQLDTAYPFESRVADDFILQPNANIITDVHWLGVYWNPGPPGNATAFNIYFYADDGTGNAPTQPGTEIASYTFPFASVNEFDTGGGLYSYDVVLPTPLALAPGVKHWITIQSVNNFPPQWGWAVHEGILLHEAVQGFPLLGLPYWSDPAQGEYDAAFQLTGIPEPATLALLGLGLVGLIRRR